MILKFIDDFLHHTFHVQHVRVPTTRRNKATNNSDFVFIFFLHNVLLYKAPIYICVRMGNVKIELPKRLEHTSSHRNKQEHNIKA